MAKRFIKGQAAVDCCHPFWKPQLQNEVAHCDGVGK